MPVTDVEQLVRQALVTILAGNSGLQTVMGRATNIVIERNQYTGDTTLPILAYELDDFVADEPARLILSAVADETQGSIKCRAVLEAAGAAMTSAAFTAQGLDVVVFDERRLSVALDPERRLGQPQLQQTDAAYSLLYLT